jgi:rhodanese-related sulfurtransferase
MKLFQFIAIFFATSLAGCGNPGTATAEKPQAEIPEVYPSVEVDAEAAAAMMKEAPEIVVIDVRTPEEFAAGHIKGAKNIDFTTADFKAKLSELDRGVTYLMHCQSGGRSGNAMPVFERLKFESVIHLNTGFLDWADSGQPVEK